MNFFTNIPKTICIVKKFKLILTFSVFLATMYLGRASKHPKLILNGHAYHIALRQVERSRWRCKKHRSNRCLAFLYTTNDGSNKIFLYNDHNHDPDEYPLPYMRSQQVVIVKSLINRFKHKASMPLG